ncbi:hypothetical protein BP5796_00805 [Coleophoma crateriformis]|uniref:Uncharacterized protein n=1 Tax=Coleophoma crateriformis TaxID=565419 RepID=A0A3D8T8X9_9HELO|nr:hypothetical protein BP5796_00805 [Coleophoma crateriformis]
MIHGGHPLNIVRPASGDLNRAAPQLPAQWSQPYDPHATNANLRRDMMHYQSTIAIQPAQYDSNISKEITNSVDNVTTASVRVNKNDKA